MLKLLFRNSKGSDDMNEQEFKKKLKEMKQELLNLKIAHERGLGVASFYEATSTVTVTPFAGQMLLYAEWWSPVDMPFPPFIIVETEFTNADVYVNLSPAGPEYPSYLFVEQFSGNIPQTFTVRLISTSPIINFELKNQLD